MQTHISAAAGPIHTNSNLIEASPWGGVHCHIYSSIGQVMGCPWAVLGAPRAGVLSVLPVTSVGDHASLMPCQYLAT